MARSFGLAKHQILSSPRFPSRPLDPSQVGEIQAAKGRWIPPTVYLRDGDRLSDLILNPYATAAASAGVALGLSALGMWWAKSESKPKALGTAVLALASSAILGWVGYSEQKDRNEETTELISRLPAGATKRDAIDLAS